MVLRVAFKEHDVGLDTGELVNVRDTDQSAVGEVAEVGRKVAVWARRVELCEAGRQVRRGGQSRMWGGIRQQPARFVWRGYAQLDR